MKKQSYAEDFMYKNDRLRLTISRVLVYIFMIFIAILCLFSFYLLLINATRSNANLQAGFTLYPVTTLLITL